MQGPERERMAREADDHLRRASLNAWPFVAIGIGVVLLIGYLFR